MPAHARGGRGLRPGPRMVLSSRAGNGSH